MALDEKVCQSCPIYGEHEPWEPDYVPDARFMVVVDPISRPGVKEDRAMPPATHKMFLKHVKTEGFEDEDFNYHPICLCPYDQNEYTNKEKKVIHKHCRAHMVNAIKEFKPEAIISLGAEPTSAVIGRSVKITKVRGLGQELDEFRQKLMPMLHPGQAVRYPENEPYLASDVAALGRLVAADYDIEKAGDVEAGEYEVVTDLQFLIDQKPDLIAFDTETTGLNWFRGGVDVRGYKRALHEGKSFFKPKFQILCMSFTVAPGNKSYVLPWDMPGHDIPESDRARLRNQLRKLLCNEDTLVVGHNCVTPDTEILTPSGWVRVDEYAGQNIMQWDPATKGMTFTRPSAYIKKPFTGDLHVWDSQMLSMAVTPEHRVFASKAHARGEFKAYTADTVGKNSPNSTYIPLSGIYESSEQLDISPNLARIMEAVRADGHIYSSSGSSYVDWKFKKTRKIQRLRELLDSHQIPYYEKVTDEGVTRIRTRSSESIDALHSLLGDFKTYGSWVLDLPIESRLAILDEARYWDGGGYQSQAGGYNLSTADEQTAIWFQAMAHSTGWRFTYAKRPNTRGVSRHDGILYSGTVAPKGDAKLQQDAILEHYDGMVYCFAVPTSAFLIRRNGRVSVTGNCKFDNVALWMTEGIRFRIGGDSLMLAAIYDENAMNKDLASMVKIHVPEMAGYSDWFDSRYNKERMWEVPWRDMIPYVGGDTIAAYKLYHVLEEKVMEDDGDWNHYCRVSIPGLNAFSAIETRGMFVDDEHALPEFQQFLTQRVEEQRQSLLAQVPREIKRQHIADPRHKGDAAKALSFTRQDFLRDILFNHPKGFRLKPVVWTKTTANLPEKMRVASTSSKDHLPYFFDECPFTMELAEYVKNERLLSTNIIGFHNKYVVNGKVRPNYSLSKTVTRRTSSDNPNGQNFPKRGQMAMTYRKMFVAPPGYYVLEVDLSQAELRIAGDMAGDPTIIKIYQTGGDIHIMTACIALGITEAQFKQLPKAEQKEWRTKAKAINFGFIYGMGWRKFIGYAKTQYGVEFSENEAKRIRAAFFKKYSKLPLWHERMRALAAKYKYVRSYSGLRRHLPMIDSPEEGVQAEAGRQAINSPVQEFGSSLGVMALGRMNDEIDPQYFEFVGFVHDAIVAYVKCEYLDWGLKTLKGYMESNPLREWFGRTMKAPILAEAGFGYNMGEIYELPDFKLDEPYDYANSPHLKDKDGKPLIEVPPQKIPPNNGRLLRSPYTTPDDLEDEDVAVRARRHRMVRASTAVSQAPKGRIKRVVKASAAPAVKRVRRTRVSSHADNAMQ